MAPSKVYVDPSIAGDSGAGTFADPYGDVRYALGAMTFDAANGTDMLLLENTTEYDSGLPMAFTATYLRRFRCGLYNSSDENYFDDPWVSFTRAKIDGGDADTPIWDLDTLGKSWCVFRGIHFTNVGSAYCVRFEHSNVFYDCEFSHSDVGGLQGTTAYRANILGCYFHDIAGVGTTLYCNPTGCLFVDGSARKFTAAIQYPTRAIRNMIWLDGSSTTAAIWMSGTNGRIAEHNSIYHDGNKGYGISYSSGDAPHHYGTLALNNAIEGFATGIYYYTRNTQSSTGNAAYNNTTNYSEIGPCWGWGEFDSNDNEVLTSSPFAKKDVSGSALAKPTWADRFAWFAPQDVDGLLTGGFPYGGNITKGAIQATGGGSSGMFRRSNWRGGF